MTGRTADAGRHGTVSAGRGLEGGSDPTPGCRSGVICLDIAGLELACGWCIGAHTLIALLCGSRIRLGIGLGTIAGLLRSCRIGLCAGLSGLTGLLGRGGTYLRLGLTGRGMAVEDSSGTAAAGAVVPGWYRTAAWSSAAAAAGTLTSYRTGCCLGHMGRHVSQNHICQCAGEPTAQRIAGDGGIQPDVGNNGVGLFRYLNNGEDEHHPGQHTETAGRSSQDRQQQVQKDHVGHHEETHGTVHPAPALENVCCVPAAADAKGQGGADGQHGQNQISFRQFQDQLKGLDDDDNAAEDHQEPRGIQTVKGRLRQQGDFCYIRRIQQFHDRGGQVQADLTDLGTGQQQKGKDEGTGEQQLGVLALKADAGHHGSGSLKYQIAQQQRPSCRQQNLPDDGKNGNLLL